MTSSTDDHQPADDRTAALQSVVDRVGAYQDGAPEGTVEQELRDGFAEAGMTVPDDEVRRLAEAVESADGRVSVAAVLGGTQAAPGA
jgi:hypothetical protein